MNLELKDVKRRYQKVSKQKSTGAIYTPILLADFVASEIVKAATFVADKDVINIFDPAVGDGQLLDSLLEKLPNRSNQTVNVYGYETNKDALNKAIDNISVKHPNVILHLQFDDFLIHVLDCYGKHDQLGLFGENSSIKYDLVIANPPYVRTQILGADKAKLLAKEFDLIGRVDLYYAFIIGISKVLQPKGIAGIIISNRFMTTKSGYSVRNAILQKYNLLKVWDFGIQNFSTLLCCQRFCLLRALIAHIQMSQFSQQYMNPLKLQKFMRKIQLRH